VRGKPLAALYGGPPVEVHDLYAQTGGVSGLAGAEAVGMTLALEGMNNSSGRTGYPDTNLTGNPVTTLPVGALKP